MQQAFTAQRQFLLISTKAKKPDISTCMEILKDLQAAMEKVDEIRQGNREPALRDPLTMVADGVGALGWVTAEGSPKPHEFISELFGGAQIFGNKVLKEYKDKYAPSQAIFYLHLTLLGQIRPTSSGYRRITSSSKPSPSTRRSITPRRSHGTRTA